MSQPVLATARRVFRVPTIPPTASEYIISKLQIAAVLALYAIGYGLVLLFLTSTAFWTYSTFYYLYIPQVSHGNAVHFVYTSSPHPTAATRLLPPNGGTRLLRPGLPYDLSLVLRVPESPHNLGLGSFMVNVTLHTHGETPSRLGPVLASSARPALLHYRSWLVRTAYRVAYLVPLALRMWDEAQELVVPLLEGYVDDHPEGPLVGAALILSQPLQVYEAKIFVVAQFSGLRYLMYHWFYTCYVLGVAFLVVYQFVFLLILKVVFVACVLGGRPDDRHTRVGSRRSTRSTPSARSTQQPPPLPSRLASGVDAPDRAGAEVEEDEMSGAEEEERGERAASPTTTEVVEMDTLFDDVFNDNDMYFTSSARNPLSSSSLHQRPKS